MLILRRLIVNTEHLIKNYLIKNSNKIILTKDQIKYLQSLGVHIENSSNYDLQDLLMRFPIKSDKLTINRGVNLLYSVYKNKWLCGYLDDEELDGYGDTPLEAVYNCFVNCVNNNIIKNG